MMEDKRALNEQELEMTTGGFTADAETIKYAFLRANSSFTNLRQKCQSYPSLRENPENIRMIDQLGGICTGVLHLGMDAETALDQIDQLTQKIPHPGLRTDGRNVFNTLRMELMG